MVLSELTKMEEFMPMNLEFDESCYQNMFTATPVMNDVKPNGEEISLFNISGNKPVLITENISKSDSNVDHLLKIIENQEKQNEKMMIQFRLKQVLLDYLKAKQSSVPSLITQPNHLNLTINESQTTYPTSTLSPSVSPDIRSQLFVSDAFHKTMPINCEVMSVYDQNVETSETKFSSDSELIEDNVAVVPSKRLSSKKCNHSTKQSQKRSAHLSAEFRYRTKLNDKISKLRTIVGPKSQLSKSGVLGKSIELIDKLQKVNNKLKEENSKLRFLLTQACNQLPASNSLV